MNESKQKQLFAAARACAPVEAPSNFPARLTEAMTQVDIRRQTATVFDQLAALFPRLATAALMVIVVATTFELLAGDDIALELAQLSDQWLLPMNWL